MIDQTIGVIDYGVCNVNAIIRMLDLLSVRSKKVKSRDDFVNVDKLILPGIGAFDHGMRALNDLNILEALKVSVLEQKKPILGVCLGMQLLGTQSEEGNERGINFIKGYSKKIEIVSFPKLKTPHMGWNSVKIAQQSPLLEKLPDNPRFYFTHSYHFEAECSKVVVATVAHGNDLVAIVQKNHIFGTQFHPEKSHKFGLSLLSGFVGFNA